MMLDIRSEPLISMAIEPKSKADQEKMSLALQSVAAEDPSFRVETDLESGQTIMRSMSEHHLDTVIDRLKREFNVEVNIGAPQVAYRETISNPTEIDYTHKKLIGTIGEFARVKLEIKPTEPDEGYSIESRIVAGAVPKKYIPGAEKGIKSVMDSGPLAGFPIIGLKVTLVDGAFHERDSSALAFEIATRAAVREGLKKAGAKLLEPIMKVEVVTPQEYAGLIMADLKNRRGMVRGQDNRGNANVIDAVAPLANMLGYGDILRSMSSRRAAFTMQFDRWALYPTRDDPDDNFPPAIGMRA